MFQIWQNQSLSGTQQPLQMFTMGSTFSFQHELLHHSKLLYNQKNFFEQKKTLSIDHVTLAKEFIFEIWFQFLKTDHGRKFLVLVKTSSEVVITVSFASPLKPITCFLIIEQTDYLRQVSQTQIGRRAAF